MDYREIPDPGEGQTRDVGGFRLRLYDALEAEGIPPHVVIYDMNEEGANGYPKVVGVSNCPGFSEPLHTRDECLGWLFRDPSPAMEAVRDELTTAFDELCEEVT